MPFELPFFTRSPSESWTDRIVLKLANIVTLVLAAGSNIYTVVSPADIYYTGKETYFTPAPWVYVMWPLIHFLLLGTIIYQFTKPGKKVIIDRLGWHLPFLNILTTIYMYSWINSEYRYALVFMIFAGSTVTQVYGVIKQTSLRNVSDEVFLHLPFSLYHGWTIVLIVVAAFEAFGVNALQQSAGGWTKAFVFLGFFFIECASMAYAYSAAEGDLPACVAISWSMWAIYAQQKPNHSEFVHWTAFAFAVVSLMWVMKSAAGLARKIWGRRGIWYGDEETTRLLVGR
ncbi:hypothetical protein BJ138DRAFT_1145212 [Hygrophoropsis aurantiaca]|uniref:Uncharacterized protein n=1 Tax=Hygrophoropsis aurantiaca TaxID=72124 RepID=A0ACB8AM07_9AGAM|nr:hypothetical protein BJ138DRAFT_1145212 [Hygrophoropsis aurantiaca]